jgi:hypothetical protein
MKTECLSIESITPYARNPRKNQSAIATVKASLKEYGWQQPLVIDRDNVIVVGHTRYAAAVELGMKEVPVKYADGLSPAQIKSYRIMDNRSAQNAEWDMELLALEFDDLKAMDFDLELTGFDDAELAGMDLAGEATTEGDTEPQVDRAEELREKWNVESGMLFALGEHRLLCGDSTKAEDVARVMGGEKADAVLTDPPYGQNQEGVPNDEPEKHSQLMADVIKQLPITDGVVVAFQSPRTFHAWTDAARKAGLTFERMLWMYKAAQCTFPWRGWILKSESIPVCSVGKANWQEVHPFAHDCYYLSEVSGELDKDSGWHGSVKPMSVVSDLLSRISAPDQIIYEPFSGSGTTIIACQNLKRKARAIEISPAYCAVALERWSTHTGITPTRHA